MRTSFPRAAAALVALSLTAAGCGGGDRQDANETAGTFNVEVVDAKFPLKQRLAQQSRLVLTVRNADTRTIPNLAVTVPGFTNRSDRTDLADPNRPVWIVDTGPEGGTTAFVNTWALGALRPGQTKTFRWQVTPVQSGAHTVSYRVAAGLQGRAKAQLAGGRTPEGSFAVRIANKPVQSRVDPATGKVVPIPSKK